MVIANVAPTKIPRTFVDKASKLIGAWAASDSPMVTAVAQALYEEHTRIKVYVAPMGLSDGTTDYYTMIQVDDRSISMYNTKIKGRAEYLMDELKHVFYDVGKPHILDYPDD